MPVTRSGKTVSTVTAKGKGQGKRSRMEDARPVASGAGQQEREAAPVPAPPPVPGQVRQQLDLQGAIMALNDNQVATQATIAQTISHRNADRALQGVPKFGGERRDNLAAFLQMIDLQEIDEPDLVRNLPKLLKGSALAWYESQPLGIITSWPALRQAMRERFGAELQRKSLMRELEGRKYRAGLEKPVDFVRDIEALCTLCGLDTAEIITWAKRGLTDLQKDYVDDRDPRTTYDVMDAMERYERQDAALRAQRIAELGVFHIKGEAPSATEELRKVNARLDAIAAAQTAGPTPTPTPIPALMSVDTSGPIMTALNAILTNQQGMQFHQQPQGHRQQQQPRFNQGRFGRNATGRTGTCRGCGEQGHFIKDCKKTRYCNHCDLGGHFITDCRWAQQGIPTPQCTGCGKKGHEAATCFKAASPN